MLQIATVSHLFGAIVFCSAAVVLLCHARTRKQIPLLVVGMALTGIWGILASLDITGVLLDDLAVDVFELFQDVVWCLCLIKLIHLSFKTPEKKWFDSPYFKVFFYALTTILLLNISFLHLSFAHEVGLESAKTTFLGNVLLSMIGLTLVEYLYFGTIPEKRWEIRFICIGLGFLFGYDFYLYVNAFFLGSLNLPLWAVRGAVLALVAPLITWGALRHQEWQSHLMPSRRLILSSTALVSCVLYMVVTAAIGDGISFFGGNWGKSLEIFFISGSIIFLGVLMTSSYIRGIAQQWIAQNFFKLRYDYRKEWLNLTQLLSQKDHTNLHQRSIKTIAKLVGSTTGWLFEKDERNQFWLAESLNSEITSLEHPILDPAFIQCLNQSLGPLTFSQGSVHFPEQLRSLPRLWLIVPFHHMNTCSHFVALAWPRIKIKMNWEVKDMLMMAGRHLSVNLVQEKGAKDLSIAKQFEALNKVSAFIAHDLKNIQSQFLLLKKNKEKHGDDPRFIASVYHSIDQLTEKFGRLLQQIRSPVHSQLQTVQLKALLNELITLRSHIKPMPVLAWKTDYHDLELEGDPSVFLNVLCHLVENAQQATPLQGSIEIIVQCYNQSVSIMIKDTGEGMSQEFIRYQLFKPFQTTKGKRGMGIGMYQAKHYVDNFGGTITVRSQSGQGTEIKMIFPIKQVHAAEGLFLTSQKRVESKALFYAEEKSS